VSGFLSAVQFLTRLPVPVRAFDLRAAVPWFPAVGLLLGAILALADLALHQLGTPGLLASTSSVVLLLVLTGALHADGVMDTCDAIFAHATPDRRLEIMRDPRVGSFGVVGLVSLVALKIASLDALPETSRWLLLLLAPAVGRWCIILLAATLPYGRLGGSGEPLKQGATPLMVGLGSLTPVVVALAGGPLAMLSGVVAVALSLVIGRWLSGLLPGLTGDCYGALCEFAEMMVWFSAALVWRQLAT
jgi:adenosylcobinamide-GDP ribazoletransferase